MRKLFLTLFILLSVINSFGQNSFDADQKIDAKVIDHIEKLYWSGKYKDCINACKHYVDVDDLRYLMIAEQKHPYRDCGKWSPLSSDAENLAIVSYYGCLASYQYSLFNFDVDSIFDGLNWAKICVAIYDDYLHEIVPNEESTIETWTKYIQYAQRAIETTIYPEHFLAIDPDNRYFKNELKWFDKKNDRIDKVFYKNVVGKEAIFANYPILQYHVFTMIQSYIVEKRNQFKDFQDIFTKRMDAFERMVQVCQQNHISSTYIPIALKSLISLLTTTVLYREFCKKAGPNYQRFCMENLIKLQDISFSLNGSVRYSQLPNYTLRDIQDCLEETDCAIIHFEAPITSGSLYFTRDLGTIYRNYAFIITRDQDVPDVWHRGYIKDDVVNDLSAIREAYPKVTRFYYVGTPRMSFIDVAGGDSSIVRLHSLSQLLTDRDSEDAISDITFIGDLNYNKVGVVDSRVSEKKGGDFEPLLGPAKQLAYINTLHSNVKPICGDDASRNVVMSEISRNNGIVHISTHGEHFSINTDFSSEELCLKKDVMDNCCLILSGYNDTPDSSLCYMSGSDVLKMKYINSDIVFLDACMSGKGAVSVVGSVGMAEAFHLIGAKNVICYLESVDDDVATEFSNRFYLELSKGASCHDAFFSAKQSINQNIKVVLWE